MNATSHSTSEQQAALFRALADPTRRAILERLAGGEATVTELTSGFDVSQPAVSQHLAALRKAGLVAERRSGRNAFYRANPDGLVPLVTWIEHYQAFWSARLPRLGTLLKEMDP